MKRNNSMEVSDDLDALAALRVCRVCLAGDRRMIDLGGKLQQAYEEISGETLSAQPGFPRRLCWECGARVLAAAHFRHKARRAHRLLAALCPVGGHITLRDVATINRHQNNLESKLSCEHLKEYQIHANESDLSIKLEIEDVENPIEVENSSEVINHGETLFCENIDWVENKYIDNSQVDFKITIELDEVINDPIDDNEKGNDDGKFTSDAKRKTTVDKNAKGVKRKRKQITKEERNTSNTDECKPTANLKDIFTVTTVSVDEQLAEIERRRDSSSYRRSAHKCDACYRGFHDKRVYNAHLLRHTEKYGAYECKICKYRQKSARCQRQHMTNFHSARYSCKECPFNTHCKSVAANHAKFHAGAKYQCRHCPRQFDKPSTYYGHMRLKHACALSCELCGHTFISQKGIELHKKSLHLSAESVTLEGPYCDTCDVTFATEDAHARHLKLSSRHRSDGDSSGIQNDPQSTLGEKTRQKRPHAGDRDSKPVCELCGIKCNSRIAYGQHFRRAHPNRTRTKDPVVRPCTYMCEQCGNKYQSMYSLNEHKRTHTGSRFYVCACGKRFVKRANLRAHAIVHDPARRAHECPVCGKRYSTRGNRQKHMLIHTGLKPFECEACGKFFGLSVQLRAHIDHVHNKKPWPKRRRRAPTED